MNVYFLNDTSSFHAGSAAVMTACRRWLAGANVLRWNPLDNLELNEEILEQCDALVVNGEGSINNTSPRARFLLDSLTRAQAAGKNTYLLNTIFQHIEPGWEDTLNAADYVCCREPASAEALRTYCGRTSEVLVDFCLAGIDSPGKPRLSPVPPVLKGTTWPWSAYHGLFDHVDVPEFAIRPDVSFADTIATLAQTGLYLTGRHHGVYAAGAAGIPFICVPSNSHKIESLIEWSGVPLPICRSKEKVDNALKKADALSGIADRFHRFLMDEKEKMIRCMTKILGELTH